MAETQEQQTNTQESQAPAFNPAEDEVVFSGSQSELDRYNQQNKQPGESGEGTGHSATPDDPEAAGSQTAPGASEGEGGQTPPETPPVEGTETVTPEGTQEQVAEPETTATPEPEGMSDEDYFSDLSSATGYEINDDDGIVNTITSLKEENEALKKKGPEMPEDMSSLLQQAYEYEKKGGNVRTFLSMVNQDTQSMSQKELIRQQFFNDHPEYVTLSPDFANQKFEREFNSKYGIVEEDREEDDFEDNIDYLKWKDDKRFAKNELDFESKKASQSIEDMKKKIIETDPTPQTQQPQVDEEEIKRTQENYLAQANEFKTDFEALEIPLDAKGEKKFNIGLNKSTRPQFENWIDSPPDFFEHIGISKDGKSINMDIFGAHVALTAAFEATGDASVGARLVTHILENFNKETLEAQLENPETPTPTGGGSQARQLSDEEEALEGFKNQAAGPYQPHYLPINDDPKK